MSAPYRHFTLAPCPRCLSESIRVIAIQHGQTARWSVTIGCRECNFNVGEMAGCDNFHRATDDAFVSWQTQPREVAA